MMWPLSTHMTLRLHNDDDDYNDRDDNDDE